MSGPEAQLNGIKLAVTEQKEAKTRNQHDPWKFHGSEETERQWPVVEFEGGHIRLCVPETFDINDHEGRVRATRHQVCQKIKFCTMDWSHIFWQTLGPTQPCVGPEHSQIPGSNSPTGSHQSRTRVCQRAGSVIILRFQERRRNRSFSLCGTIASHKYGHTPSY